MARVDMALALQPDDVAALMELLDHCVGLRQFFVENQDWRRSNSARDLEELTSRMSRLTGCAEQNVHLNALLVSQRNRTCMPLSNRHRYVTLKRRPGWSAVWDVILHWLHESHVHDWEVRRLRSRALSHFRKRSRKAPLASDKLLDDETPLQTVISRLQGPGCLSRGQGMPKLSWKARQERREDVEQELRVLVVLILLLHALLLGGEQVFETMYTLACGQLART